jgi:hypothetical protein
MGTRTCAAARRPGLPEPLHAVRPPRLRHPRQVLWLSPATTFPLAGVTMFRHAVPPAVRPSRRIRPSAWMLSPELMNRCVASSRIVENMRMPLYRRRGPTGRAGARSWAVEASVPRRLTLQIELGSGRGATANRRGAFGNAQASAVRGRGRRVTPQDRRTAHRGRARVLRPSSAPRDRPPASTGRRPGVADLGRPLAWRARESTRDCADGVRWKIA